MTSALSELCIMNARTWVLSKNNFIVFGIFTKFLTCSEIYYLKLLLPKVPFFLHPLRVCLVSVNGALSRVEIVMSKSIMYHLQTQTEKILSTPFYYQLALYTCSEV